MTGQENYQQSGRKAKNGTQVVVGHFSAIKKEYSKLIAATKIVILFLKSRWKWSQTYRNTNHNRSFERFWKYWEIVFVNSH